MSSRAAGASPLRLLGLGVLVSLALWPFVPQLAAKWAWARPFARGCELWFALHCERDPARTPVLLGLPLAVCARCAGIYFGVGLGALLRRPRLEPQALRLWVMLGAALMLVDVMLEEHGLHGSWPTLRYLTGLLLAYPVGAGLGAALTRAPATAQSP